MLFPKYIVLHGATDASQLSSLISRQDYGLLRDFLTQTFGAKPDEIDQSQLLILQLNKAGELIILHIQEEHFIKLLRGD
jgi:hypothetical protein